MLQDRYGRVAGYREYRLMTLLQGFGFWSSSLSGAAPGMVLLTPTSITHSGTSASIGANGQVTFTAVTSLSLNGVFSADFDNYVVSFSSDIGPSASIWRTRLRASGSDATGSDYADQLLNANGSTVSASRRTAQDNARSGYLDPSQWNGYTGFFYGPFLAQPTAGRYVSTSAYLSAEIQEEAWTHSLSTAYDGFTVYASSGMTGTIQVYGVRS
jgi:hypothetical protein